jgi:hypothetical protein
MLPDDLVQHGQHVLTVCNACRYCECLPCVSGTRKATDVRCGRSYVSRTCATTAANALRLQFAPPHEFGINVPRCSRIYARALRGPMPRPPVLSRAFRQRVSPGLAALASCSPPSCGHTLANGQAIVSSDAR